MKRSNGIQRVTMQDIARQTGYSVNTVSHALRNKDDISRETRERIQKVARNALRKIGRMQPDCRMNARPSFRQKEGVPAGREIPSRTDALVSRPHQV